MKTAKERLIIKNLSSMKLDKLIELWEETEKQKITVESAIVRGWIMDALETIDPAAFDEYIDNCHINDDMRFYFTKKTA